MFRLRRIPTPRRFPIRMGRDMDGQITKVAFGFLIIDSMAGLVGHSSFLMVLIDIVILTVMFVVYQHTLQVQC